jgi:5-methylthioadenosine/S-adenosylhomocysteine deaminase
MSWPGTTPSSRHVYLDAADLVFKGNEVVHVGPGYTGPVDTTISGKGFMAIPAS